MLIHVEGKESSGNLKPKKYRTLGLVLSYTIKI